jgi:hypothetical protein
VANTHRFRRVSRSRSVSVRLEKKLEVEKIAPPLHAEMFHEIKFKALTMSRKEREQQLGFNKLLL